MTHDTSPRDIRILIEPGSIDRRVAHGSLLSNVLRQAGVEFPYPCGGARLCGRCRVDFQEGAPPPSEEEKNLLAFDDIERGARLACCVRLTRDARLVLPGAEESGQAASHTEHILTQGVRSDVVVDPEVRKYRCEPLPSTLQAPLSDWMRVARALPAELRDAARPTLGVLRKLPQAIAQAVENGLPVTLTMRAHRAIHVESGDRVARHYGVAVDLGTTTITVALIDLGTGAELGVAGCLNPQRAFGYDLISRISAAMESAENLQTLHAHVIDAISASIVRLCAQHEVDPLEVLSMALAGNTVMTHLFLRVDPSGLGQAPFAGVLRSGVRIEAAGLGLPIHPEAPVFVLPCIGGFVGGDITAGILLTRLMDQPGVSVLVDIGTNGEVVVARDGRLMATSSAAGPAFEGGRIACGMYASDGAVDRVEFDGQDLRLHTLGGDGRAPLGLCGSGLIEAFARLLDTGLIAMNGRILKPDSPEAARLTPALAARLETDDAGAPRVRLDGPAKLYITQADAREFQLAKGAVAAAVRVTLDDMGIALDQIDRFLVAGAFGNRLNIEDAMTLGLLPELPREKVFFIGNSSMEGARCILLNRYERQRAEDIAESTGFVELAERPDFQERFAMAMMLGPLMDL